MTKEELIQLIDNGSDILLDVMNRHFTILTWPEQGIAIGEQYPNDGKMRYFNTPAELVEMFVINGKTLAMLADQIVITQYS